MVTLYENIGKLGGTLLDIRFCALNNESVVTHEVRRGGHHIVKREKTGKVTMTCHPRSASSEHTLHDDKKT
jgi:hypothetical protein